MSRAYLHNLDIFDEFQFGEGDTIHIYKANMIIPQIADNKPSPIPIHCRCAARAVADL